MSTTPLKVLLEQLLEVGERPDKSLLQMIEDHGEAAVPQLVEIVTDPELIWADSDSPEVWAPTHAMRLLGRLRAVAAISPLIALLEDEEEQEKIVVRELGGRGFALHIQQPMSQDEAKGFLHTLNLDAR